MVPLYYLLALYLLSPLSIWSLDACLHSWEQCEVGELIVLHFVLGRMTGEEQATPCVDMISALLSPPAES